MSRLWAVFGSVGVGFGLAKVILGAIWVGSRGSGEVGESFPIVLEAVKSMGEVWLGC